MKPKTAKLTGNLESARQGVPAKVTPTRIALPNGWSIIQHERMPVLVSPEGQQLWGCAEWDAVAFAAAMATQDVAVNAVAPSPLAWKPIETAPKDREVIVLARELGRIQSNLERLPPMVANCKWHPDAGWCVCELREVTHWLTETPQLEASQPVVAQKRGELQTVALSVLNDLHWLISGDLKPEEGKRMLAAHQRLETALAATPAPSDARESWTPELRKICAGKNGDRGEPACWELHNLTSDVPNQLPPCAECLKEAAPSDDARECARQFTEPMRSMMTPEDYEAYVAKLAALIQSHTDKQAERLGKALDHAFEISLTYFRDGAAVKNGLPKKECKHILTALADLKRGVERDILAALTPSPTGNAEGVKVDK